MGSPISPGDVVMLAQGIYKMYKKFSDAPAEMRELAEQVDLVEVYLRFLTKPSSEQEFLNSPDGKELSAFVQRRLRRLRQTLRQVKNVGKEWKKAKKNWLRRAPFIFYTMRSVPGLQEKLKEELQVVNLVRVWANQAGVNLGPKALKQIADAAHAEDQDVSKAKGKDQFKEVEKRRRAACSALSRSARTSRPASVAERKTDAWKTLRESGLPDGDAQVISELYELEFQKIAAESAIIAIEDEKSQGRFSSIKSVRSVKAISKPKVRVVQKKPVQAPNKDGPATKSKQADAAKPNQNTDAQKPKDTDKKSVLSKPKKSFAQAWKPKIKLIEPPPSSPDAAKESSSGKDLKKNENQQSKGEKDSSNKPQPQVSDGKLPKPQKKDKQSQDKKPDVSVVSKMKRNDKENQKDAKDAKDPKDSNELKKKPSQDGKNVKVPKPDAGKAKDEPKPSKDKPKIKDDKKDPGNGNQSSESPKEDEGGNQGEKKKRKKRRKPKQDDAIQKAEKDGPKLAAEPGAETNAEQKKKNNDKKIKKQKEIKPSEVAA